MSSSFHRFYGEELLSPLTTLYGWKRAVFVGLSPGTCSAVWLNLPGTFSFKCYIHQAHQKRYSSAKAMSILYQKAFYTDIKCSPVQYERQRNRTGTSWSHTSNFVPERMAVQSKDKLPPQNRVDPTILQSFSLTHRHLSIKTDIFCQSQMCPSERINCSLCVSLIFILLAIKLRRRISSSPPPHRSCTRERVPFDALVLMCEQKPYPVW